MRKKIYFQNSFGPNGEQEFTKDGLKPTFGIFSKGFQERKLANSEKRNKELRQLRDFFASKQYYDLSFSRYHGNTDFNYYRTDFRNTSKAVLFLLCMRELPLKNFYARAFVIGTLSIYLFEKNWHYFDSARRPAIYPSDKTRKEFCNYPMLYQLVAQRVPSKLSSPVILEHDYWWTIQNPVYYLHHFKHYRYVFRHRRVVPWDGTFSQPVVPFMGMSNKAGLVHAGTNEEIEPKGSANC